MRSGSFAALLASSLALVSGYAVHEPCGEDLSCPSGKYCEVYKSGSAVCVPVGTSPSFDDPKRLFARQNTPIPVTGASGVRNRLNIVTLQSNEPDTFNMFLLGLAAMQNVVETHPLSYYQIAGIHGRPFIPWREATSPSQDPSTGYCTHDSALFATWHRPYLMLFEQRLSANAINEASKFTGGEASRWQNAAQRVRLPFWDWASADLQSSIPAIVRQTHVEVTRPGTNGVPTRVTIRNPLYQYAFTDSNMKNQYFDGFWRNAAATRRHPPASGTSSDNNAADLDMRNTYAARRQNTYNLFSIPSFREFSNTAFSAGGQPNAWTSVESIHGEVHVNCGGDLGHMTYLDYSAFDPIFWLHHANVDRLITMYQAIYPGRVVEPQPASGTFARRVSSGDVDDVNTPLWPFRKTDGNLYTSVDVSSHTSTWNNGYSYPDVPYSMRTSTQQQLRDFVVARVNTLYGSQNAAVAKRQTGGTRREWLCHIVFAPSEVKNSAQVLVFLGNTTANTPSERRAADNLVGSGVAFSRHNHASDKSRKITAVVPLTEHLMAAGVDINNVTESVAYLVEQLNWKMQTGTDSVPLSQVPSLRVGVSAAPVEQPSSPEQLPKWGEFDTYYEVTDKKQGGLKLQDRDMVRSNDKPKVLPDDKGSSSSASSASATSSAQPEATSVVAESSPTADAPAESTPGFSPPGLAVAASNPGRGNNGRGGNEEDSEE